jgi:intracellular sulfur oxidation DsrE/DsrF family protein
MYMKVMFLIVSVMLFVPVAVLAQKKKQEAVEASNHKIVIQFNEADSVSQVRALMQVENIRKVWADAEIELVCLGMGLDLLTSKNSKVRTQIETWAAKGVTFAACNNTMTIRNIKKEDLLTQALVIPAAVIELATKQEAGWSYFRGGK